MTSTTIAMKWTRPLSAFLCSTNFLTKRTAALLLVAPISSSASTAVSTTGKNHAEAVTPTSANSRAARRTSSSSTVTNLAAGAHSRPPPHRHGTTSSYFGPTRTALYSTGSSNTNTNINNKQQPRRSMSSLPDTIEDNIVDSSSAAAAASSSSWPRFAEINHLHEHSQAALQKMGLVRMTEIQHKTFDAAVAGRDVLARSRTGTGKTLAFLLPALERIRQYNHNHQNPNNNNNNNVVPAGIQMLILCPTRELAIQTGEQTRQLTSSSTSLDSNMQISHQVMFGGASRSVDVNRLKKSIPTILIATPGRLQDHLDNTNSFAKLFQQHTHLLVLDEMDRLLDMGFRQAVEKIVSNLPSQEKRQTLLFSATLPTDVKHVIARTLKSNFVTVDCIHDADPASHTNDLVHQSHVVAPVGDYVESTVRVLLHILETDPQCKMIVFFPTTKMVKFYAELFNEEGMMQLQGRRGKHSKVVELHSGKSQAYRTAASNTFRQVTKETGGGVLFTSDVSARGVDYQDVTHVVQVGMADSRETYIHRLGRTARANKKGLGIIILSDLEARGYLKTLKGLDIQVNAEMQNVVDGAPSTAIVQQLHPVLQSIRTGQNPSLEESAKASYRGMLGYYRSQLKRIGIPSSEQLVEFANSYSLQTGLVKVPTLLAKTAKNMGLYGVAGIVCDDGKGDGGGRGTSGRSVAPRRGGGSSSGIGNQDTRPRGPFGRTGSGYSPEGGRWISTFRNGNESTPWRSSTPSKPFAIKRTTTGPISRNAAPGDRRSASTSAFRNGNDVVTSPPHPPLKREAIKGKSEKWNRRRGKSEWVDREEKTVAASWKNENYETFQKPAPTRRTTPVE